MATLDDTSAAKVTATANIAASEPVKRARSYLHRHP
jgi:hypothetical protein